MPDVLAMMHTADLRISLEQKTTTICTVRRGNCAPPEPAVIPDEKEDNYGCTIWAPSSHQSVDDECLSLLRSHAPADPASKDGCAAAHLRQRPCRIILPLQACTCIHRVVNPEVHPALARRWRMCTADEVGWGAYPQECARSQATRKRCTGPCPGLPSPCPPAGQPQIRSPQRQHSVGTRKEMLCSCAAHLQPRRVHSAPAVCQHCSMQQGACLQVSS